MKTALFSLAIALALATAGCHNSSCKPDAGDELSACRPNDADAGDFDAGGFDGGSVDCQSGEACVSLPNAPANKRCLKPCNGGCPEGYDCGAVAIGNCSIDHPDASQVDPPDGDGGKPSGGGVGCYTYFLCYPNRC